MKLFSFPLQGSPLDEGGWEAYGEDWKYFFDCMLAPVARQVGAHRGQYVLEFVLMCNL